MVMATSLRRLLIAAVLTSTCVATSGCSLLDLLFPPHYMDVYTVIREHDALFGNTIVNDPSRGFSASFQGSTSFAYTTYFNTSTNSNNPANVRLNDAALPGVW